MLDEDPALPPEKGTAAPTTLFGPCLFWPSGWMDQGATWYGGRPRFRPHCVGWGLSSTPKGAQQPPIFGPCLLWPNGWMNHDTTCSGGRPRPRRHCFRWDPAPPRKGTSLSPLTFRPTSIVAKRSSVSAAAELWYNLTLFCCISVAYCVRMHHLREKTPNFSGQRARPLSHTYLHWGGIPLPISYPCLASSRQKSCIRPCLCRYSAYRKSGI